MVKKTIQTFFVTAGKWFQVTFKFFQVGDSMIYEDENGFYFIVDGYKWYLAGLSLSVVCG